MTATHTPDKALAKENLEGLIEGDPVALISGGDTVDGIKGNFLTSQEVVAAGLQGVYDFSVMSCLGDWTSVPDDDTVVSVDGTNQRLLRSATDALDVGVRMDFGSEFADYNAGER